MTTAPRRAVGVFLVFAFAYFLSALVRAVTATLAPVFSTELGLQAADLGLLAGAYFLGFAAMQLPLGWALDRFGPRRVLVALLVVAVLGCVVFASAQSLWGLILGRALIGVGVGACLMAPLTSYRRLLNPQAQLRANSWMLMTGSLGMLASTLPVQWLLPWTGWRGLFWAIAGLFVVAMIAISMRVPRDAPPQTHTSGGGYAEVWRHPLLLRMAPLGFFLYGGFIAVQTLWAGPWLTRVSGWSASQAAAGLFLINLCMLVTFMIWGGLMPRLGRWRIGAVQVMSWGVPLSLALLALNVVLGPKAGAVSWAAWCVASTCVTLSQPSVGQAFAAGLAGRAMSAFNLVIFGGVFCVQWGIGVVVDILIARGFAATSAFQAAFSLFWLACAASYVWFMMRRSNGSDNQA